MSEVVVTSGENLKQLIRAGNHTLVVTLQLYAKRKQFPLEQVEVTLSQSRIHGKDCAECDTKDDYVTRISSHIKLIGPLNDEQRARLMEIAGRCPVHRVLSAEISVEDTLA
jgi:putative redox protein